MGQSWVSKCTQLAVLKHCASAQERHLLRQRLGSPADEGAASCAMSTHRITHIDRAYKSPAIPEQLAQDETGRLVAQIFQLLGLVSDARYSYKRPPTRSR